MQEKREFNFALRWEEKNQKIPRGWFGLENGLLGGVAVGAVLLTALAVAPWIWEYKIQNDLRQINAKISGLQVVDKLWQEAKGLEKRVQNQAELLSIMQKGGNDPGPLWTKLNQLFPAGTVVSSFGLQANNGVTLTVTVPTPVEAAQLWVKLRDSGLFQEIDIQNVSLQDKVQTLNLNLKLK